MSDTLADKAVKGTVWSACDRFGTMALTFLVNIILARLLTPDDFGVIGMLTIFISVSQVFVDSGLGSSLIQKKEPTQTDYSTVLFWNIGVGVVIYAILFACAHLVADFYKMPLLENVFKAIGVTLVLSCISGIQANRLQKQLRFKDLAITNFGTYLIGGMVGISMAFYGWGAWSLVAMMIVQGVSRIILLYAVSHWYPSLIFSKDSFRQLFAFGGYLFLSNLLETICRNLQGLIIGHRFSAAQMGYYSQASKLDNITSYVIPQIIAAVMYPVFSQLQDEKDRLNALAIMDIRVISLIIFPLLAMLIIVSDSLILFLYGQQWLPAALYFRILCIGGFFMCLNNIPYYVVATCGKSRPLFFAGFYKWGMLGVFSLIGMTFGMTGIIWSISISLVNIFCTNIYLARKYSGLSIRETVKALVPSYLLVLLTSAIVLLADHLMDTGWIVNILIFVFTYCLSVFLSKPRAYIESKSLLSRIVKFKK